MDGIKVKPSSMEFKKDSLSKSKIVDSIKNSDNRIQFSTDVLNDYLSENELSVDFVEYLLTFAGQSNPLKAACEEYLRRTLSCSNYWKILSLSDTFGLCNLRSVILDQIKSGCFKDTGKYLDVSKITEQTSHDDYEIYQALFTIEESNIQVIVLDSSQRTRCYRVWKHNVKITDDLQVCSLHHDSEDSPYVFLSYGEKMCIYDPVRNKKLQKINCRRCRFSVVGVHDKCYEIGGTYNGQDIRSIDCYDLNKKKWQAISCLPDSVRTTGLSCEVVGQNIYILTFDMANRKNQDLVVCVFDTDRGMIDTVTKFSVSCHQIKTCSLLHNIFIATDDGHFFRLNTNDGSVTNLPNQITKCRDFGMFTIGSSVFLVGGENVVESSTNIIHSFSIVSMNWHQHHKTLPNQMRIYGNCDIKIPKSSNATIVPFYINNHHEIPSIET